MALNSGDESQGCTCAAYRELEKREQELLEGQELILLAMTEARAREEHVTAHVKALREIAVRHGWVAPPAPGSHETIEAFFDRRLSASAGGKP